MKTLTTRTALLTILDAVDYTAGACGVGEPVGGVLPPVLIANARDALAGIEPKGDLISVLRASSLDETEAVLKPQQAAKIVALYDLLVASEYGRTDRVQIGELTAGLTRE